MAASVELLDPGVVDYAVALAWQRELFDRLIAAKSNYELQTGDALNAGWIILCEHLHIYTLGRSGKVENLLVSEEFLREKGAALHRIERGGDITYHGPGQIVGYPILDLELVGLGLRGYIEAMEQSVIETVGEFGIEAGRVEGKTGVWVGGAKAEQETPFLSKMAGCKACDGAERGAYSNVCDELGDEHNEADGRFSRKRKICAIGVKASKGVVMHGFALNVATDLSWFGYINPCGFAGGSSAVTSMEKETGRGIALDEVKNILCQKLEKNMNINIKQYANRKTMGYPRTG